MFVKRNTYKTGRTSISISKSYRDEQGKSKSRVIKGLGYYDVLEREHDDPEAFIQSVLERAEQEEALEQVVTSLPIHMNEKLTAEDAKQIYNFGSAAFSYFYHLLELDYVINNRRRYTKAEYNHNAILKMLVYSQLINPGSKKASFEKKHQFFDKMDFSLEDVYRSLDFFKTHSDAIVHALDARIEQVFGRDKSVFYYDVTNYYFEIDREDDFRIRGPSKEFRPLPIVQLGLFLDAQGLPLSFKLFEGNTHDSKTFFDSFSDVNSTFRPKDQRVVVVADNGMFSGDNIRQVLLNKQGFIVAYSLKKGTDALKKFAFDTSGYSFVDTVTDPKTGKLFKQIRPWNPKHTYADEVVRFKEIITPYEIHVSSLEGKKTSVKLDTVKIVVSYSPKYAAKAKEERAKIIEKLQKRIASGRVIGSNDVRKYIATTSFSKESGEEVDVEQLLAIDEEKLARDAQFDGLHAIFTTELDLPASQVVRKYRGLWEIEETFRISKKDLKTRPVFVSTLNHIKAHFLISFLALTILRLLEKQIGEVFTTSEILNALRESKAYYLGDNIYRFYHTDPCLEAIGKATGIDFSRKYMTKAEIRKTFAATKKFEN